MNAEIIIHWDMGYVRVFDGVNDYWETLAQWASDASIVLPNPLPTGAERYVPGVVNCAHFQGNQIAGRVPNLFHDDMLANVVNLQHAQGLRENAVLAAILASPSGAITPAQQGVANAAATSYIGSLFSGVSSLLKSISSSLTSFFTF